ncbi:hypothetical protein A2U01_0073313, partial [Trifolium medium]|jgi:DNA invertase Pin-like site-specific DNA recombinase
MFGE